jgi:hypothetical protein
MRGFIFGSWRTPWRAQRILSSKFYRRFASRTSAEVCQEHIKAVRNKPTVWELLVDRENNELSKIKQTAVSFPFTDANRLFIVGVSHHCFFTNK